MRTLAKMFMLVYRFLGIRNSSQAWNIIIIFQVGIFSPTQRDWFENLSNDILDSNIIFVTKCIKFYSEIFGR